MEVDPSFAEIFKSSQMITGKYINIWFEYSQTGKQSSLIAKSNYQKEERAAEIGAGEERDATQLSWSSCWRGKNAEKEAGREGQRSWRTSKR